MYNKSYRKWRLYIYDFTYKNKRLKWGRVYPHIDNKVWIIISIKMYIKKVILENFRNYDNQEISFCDNINLIYGNNAERKN